MTEYAYRIAAEHSPPGWRLEYLEGTEVVHTVVFSIGPGDDGPERYRYAERQGLAWVDERRADARSQARS